MNEAVSPEQFLHLLRVKMRFFNCIFSISENSLAAVPAFPSASLFSLAALDLVVAPLFFRLPDFGHIHSYEARCEQFGSFISCSIPGNFSQESKNSFLNFILSIIECGNLRYL